VGGCAIGWTGDDRLRPTHAGACTKDVFLGTWDWDMNF